MTPFEYVTIPVSIVLALGIGKLLGGVVSMFEPDKRDWIFIAWCFALLMLFLGQWVAIWRLNDNESWSVLEFMSVMLSPIIYYSAAHILISGQPESISSWSSHLSRIARPLIWILIAATVNAILRNYFILGVYDTNFVLVVLIPVIVVNLAAMIRPSRKLLALAALGWLIPPGLLIAFAPDL